MPKSPKTREEYLNFLNEKEEIILTPLKDKIKELKESDKASSVEYIALDKYLKTLKHHFADLKLKQPLIDISVASAFWIDCEEATKVAIKAVKAEHSWGRLIIDTLKDIGNFCIMLMSLGSSHQFFTTSTKTLDSAKREINNTCKELYKSYMDDPKDSTLPAGIKFGGNKSQ